MSDGRNLDLRRNGIVSRKLRILALASVLVCGTWVSQAADEPPAAPGLKGILPQGVPADLLASIAGLPENWAKWGEGLNADLEALYVKEDLDAAGQRKAIETLRARLATVKSSLADPRYKSMSNVLVSLGGSLKRRLDVAQAALDTVQLGPDINAARLEAAKKDVAAAAAALDKYLATIKTGAGWSTYAQVSEVRSAVGGKDAAQVVQALATAQSKLTAELPDERAREFLKRPEFAAYQKAVDNYLAIASAPVPAANSEELRKSLGELLNAIEDFESNGASAAAAAVRTAFTAVTKSAPDGGEKILQAMRNNYFNYNLRVVATEAFLNKVISQRRQESSGVRDFILGANVSGSQTTVTQVGIDLKASANVAQFDLTANGSVASNTVGTTDQADIYTYGSHQFWASKRVLFNGDSFWTQPARISVNANNTTTGADTHMGLFSGIGNRIAMRRANEMRGESEAIAASRIQDRVLPQFNSEVDKEFGAKGEFNGKIGERLTALREERLYPQAKVYSTTEDELRVATRLMDPNELGGSELNPALILGRGVTILVHDTLMNNAIDRLDVAGQTLSDDQFKAKLEAQFTKLLGREVKFKTEETTDAEQKSQMLIFDKADPIRFHAGDGTLTVTLRVGIHQEGKEDIPTQAVTLPLSFSVDMKNVVVEPGAVSVAAAEKAADAGTQLARAGVIKKKIEASFPRREIDRVATIERHHTKAVVAVTRIKALDGWLSITFE